jgi:hypothetical protein
MKIQRIALHQYEDEMTALMTERMTALRPTPAFGPGQHSQHKERPMQQRILYLVPT